MLGDAWIWVGQGKGWLPVVVGCRVNVCYSAAKQKGEVADGNNFSDGDGTVHKSQAIFSTVK